MAIGNVGAGILNVITESLYDKPIVVFREYVQNAVDSFAKISGEIEVLGLKCQIWRDKDDLYFLDNGMGIEKENFNDEMINIGKSGKRKSRNIGYKGIGRLSGIPYCQRLIFINIASYSNGNFQRFTIDGTLYNEIKNSDEYYELDWEELIEKIGVFEAEVGIDEIDDIKKILERYPEMFEKSDTGFLVILNGIKGILNTVMEEEDFLQELGWLLPVNLKKELFELNQKDLFYDMLEPVEGGIVPAKGYNIYFDNSIINSIIERPITPNMLRYYTCKLNLRYAVGFHTFLRDKIAVIKGNDFSGIRIYIDNMLLCDESELLPILQQYGFIKHTVNELVQTVKGIGAMIYITDKVSISANARRTFIEVIDSDSLEFLKLLAEFVESIYEARYALSKYSSGVKKVEVNQGQLSELKNNATAALLRLAREEIKLEDQEPIGNKNFEDLSETEQKQVVKRKINKMISDRVKTYLSQTTSYNYESAFEDFKTWLHTN